MFSLTTWWYILERHFELNLNGEGKGFQYPLRYQVVQWNLAGFSKCTQLGPLVTLGAWKTHAVDEVDWLFLNQRPNTYKTIHTVYVCMSICCILYTVCRVLNVCVFICCTLYTSIYYIECLCKSQNRLNQSAHLSRCDKDHSAWSILNVHLF